MKKLNHIISLLVLALFGLLLTACSKNELNTDQYVGDFSLNAFGPCPVLRGGTLYFYGTNLDQVTEIDLPGSGAITAIDVLEKGAHSKISITVPAEGGVEGLVTLKSATGKEITSVSPITFREDITITSVFIGEEGNLTGDVGDLVTIKGDYLNLMNGVTFAGGYTVTELESHDRYTITVRIPKEATSGKLTLTDLAETPTELQTDEAITINLPEPTPVALTLKAGETITITGVGMDQIQSVLLQGATIEESDITLSEDGKSISFKLPEAAADGEITLVTYSGSKISAGTVTSVVPSNLAVVGQVKNGQKMTVSGKDLELVKSLSFANAGGYEGEFTVSANQVVITQVPETAQDGDLTLTMMNGKSVTVVYTLVKPTVSGVDPATITAGEEIVISGTDLDLVASIIFPGDAEQTVAKADFVGQQEEGIQLNVPAACSGSDFKLILVNGTEVAAQGVLTINPATDPAISESPAGGVAGEEVTIKGKNFNNVANLYIGDVKVTRYVSRSNTEITFKVPEAEVGDYKIIMEDFDGKKYEGPAFAILPSEITIWEGTVGPPNWNGDQTIPFTSEMKAQLVVGKTLGIEFTVNNGWGQMEICGSWWTQLQGPKDAWVASGNSLNEEGRAIMNFSTSGVFEFLILQGDIDILTTQGAMLFVGGGELYVTRLYVK